MFLDYSTEELAAYVLLFIAIGYLTHVIWIMVRSIRPDE